MPPALSSRIVRTKPRHRAPVRRTWAGVVRDVLYVAAHALYVLGAVQLYLLLICDDPSTVDDSLIAALLGYGFLGSLLLVAFVIAGAPPKPALSAVLPPLVLFTLPWRDVHDAAVPTLLWLLVHMVLLAGCAVTGPRLGLAARRGHGSTKVAQPVSDG